MLPDDDDDDDDDDTDCKVSIVECAIFGDEFFAIPSHITCEVVWLERCNYYAWKMFSVEVCQR